MSESEQDAAADELMHRLRARYATPPTYLGKLEIVEPEGREYETFAAYIRKNMRQPLI